MKKTNGILVLCLILTSCYSYRPMKDGESVVLGKMHQIRSIENTKENLRIWEIGDTIKGISATGKRLIIPSGNVLEVRKRKFSTVQTGILVGTVSGVVVLAATDLSFGNFKNMNLWGPE